ncbi:MAG: aa3-type cytochrome c oxidase subunit IV [Alphaproteobacteria bacterium]|nr:MAG: aa3-type cytochrome c oxidase subunit IV [Alphaproteobacteria bacterium]
MAKAPTQNNDAYYVGNKKTYEAFLRMTVIGIVCVVVLLAGMAFFLV